MSFLPFAIFVLAAAGLLALFLPSKQVLLIGIATAAGIVADVLLHWSVPAPGDAYQIKFMLIASVPLYALAAVLGHVWPWKAWQWGLIPFLAAALWNVAGPYATVHWGNLGPIPYVFPFYVAVWASLPAIVVAELAAYFGRRKGAGGSPGGEGAG